MAFVPVLRPRRVLPILFGGLLIPECIVILFGILALALYDLFGLTLRAPLLLYSQRISSSVPCYAIGLIIVLAFLRLLHIREGRRAKQFVPHRVTWQIFREHFLRPKKIWRDVRLINVICCMFVVFVNLKHLIPYINPNILDRFLYRFEASLFRGRIASEILIEKLGTEIAPVMSSGYVLFYAYVAIVIYIFIFQMNDDLTQEFLTAFVLTWFVGLLVVYIAPTLGPVFSSPGLFQGLPFTEVTTMQERLWSHKLILERSPDSPGAIYLISGLPSLHLAVPIVGSYYLRRVHLLVAGASWLFVGFTFVTTLYFGWHFLLDDICAGVLAYFIVRYTRYYFAPRYVYVPEPLPHR